MRAVTFLGPDRLEWREVADPVLASDGEAIVRPLAVATCDLDDVIVLGGSPFQPPFVLGHECVAEVVEVGDGVRGVTPGDRVVVPFQINCGVCAACLAGRTGNCLTVPLMSTYGFGFGAQGTRWGGFLADLIHVPYADAMLIPVPAGLASETAAGASDNLTDGFRAVGPYLAERPGAPVLVVGGAGPGSIGLYAAAQAKALRSERVLYIDHDVRRRGIAESYGVETLDHIPDRLDSRFPITVDSSNEARGLTLALESMGRDGVCTSTSIYFDPAVRPAFPLLSMYTMNSTFVTGRIHARRDAPRLLELLASGRFDPAPVTTRVVSFADAIEALLGHEYTKLVFTP
ncbi:zinc-dependent alcohol dehydrogenase [Nocardia alni]|uniref:zinc-dependent alcohol dehydrogenase n=1 Tax=Nocardia alni TaxID=2815723 RepID=UPI0020B2B9AD|nr:alcohol dehydrogenase catalytic domain-containing protein [Nocardia alni]